MCFGSDEPRSQLSSDLKQYTVGGKSTGIYTSLLHGLGVGSYALLVVTTTSLALQSYSFIESILEIGGAGLLCLLALQSWPKKSSHNSQDQVDKTSVWTGLLIVLFNPKITIFFLAIFSPSLGTISGWLNWVGLAVMVGVIDAVWYILVVLVASTSLFQISDEIWRRRIGKTMSIVMALVALEIVVNQISSVI